MKDFYKKTKENIARHFSDKSLNYDNYSEVQAKSVDDLLQINAPFIRKLIAKNSFDKKISVLDLGSGTSFIARKMIELVGENHLLDSCSNLKVTELDLSLEMLKQWKSRPSDFDTVNADMESLPFKPNSFDVVISSFALQWSDQHKRILEQIFLILKPNGIFSFCSPNSDSLTELKAAEIFPLNQLPVHKKILQNLKESNFTDEIACEKTITQEFENGYDALRSFKKIGANNSDRKRQKFTKKHLQKFNDFCQRNFEKKFPLSWKISYFVCSKLTTTQ